MHALGRLIHECRAIDRALTYRHIAELAGDEFTSAAVWKWANKKHTKLDEIPRPRSILALAQALNVPPLRVLLAAAEAAGIDVSNADTSQFAKQLPARVDELPPDERELILRLIWTLTDKAGKQ